MNRKLFIFLVVLLSTLILASLIWLLVSINTYNRSKYPQEKPSYFSDSKKDEEKNEVVVETKNDNPVVESIKLDLDDLFFGETVIELKESDLDGLDYEILNEAYNAIFARHGHDFKTKTLKDFFSKYSWYKPVEGKTVGTSDLSELENKNLNLIKTKIDQVKAQ